MWLFFSEKAEDAGQAAAAATGGRVTGLGRGDPADLLRKKKNFERLVAVGNVIATRVSQGRAPKVKEGEAARAANVQELTLQSGKLEHDARTGRAGVDGPGRVTIYEYSPETVRQADRVPVSTTDVTWQGKMVYDAERMVLLFAKDVVTQVKGREMKIAGAMPTSVQSGMMKTQDLRIFLKKADGSAAVAGTGGTGSGLLDSGQFELRHLIASQQTSFTNDKFAGSGDRLTYDAERELMVLDGRKDALAKIWQRSADGSKDSRQAGERIMYWVKQERAVVTGPEIDALPSRR